MKALESSVPRQEEKGMFTHEDIRKVRVSFKCPVCDKWTEEELMYIPTKRGKPHPKTASSHWCNHCGVRHSIDYRIFKKRDGSPKIKVFKLSSNEKEFVRRFKVIAWC